MIPLLFHLTGSISISLLFFLTTVTCFYLPGVKMVTYENNQVIPMYVNSLTSTETLLPVENYKLPFCKPNEIKSQAENLGEYLTANRIENSPYDIHFLKPLSCAVVCRQTYNPAQMALFDAMIREQYRVHWILDNLPSATEPYGGRPHELGFPLGRYNKELDKQSQLYNHVILRIGYTRPAEPTVMTETLETFASQGGRIVDFLVSTDSFDYLPKTHIDDNGKVLKCDRDITIGNVPVPEPIYIHQNTKKSDITWTYSVQWIEMPERKWRTRWDVYFDVGSGSKEVHWFSIVNALMIVLVLSGMVLIILLRALKRDINQYNRVPTEEERADEREESGWKLIHADVFRPPTKYPMLFSVCIGTGTQLLCMAVVTLVFAALGFTSPSNRGNLMITILVLFVLMGSTAGYVSSQTYKLFRGKQWQLNTTLTAIVFPGLTFALFFLLNLFAWAAGSDAAVPFGSMIVLVVLWFGISVPLVFAGAYFGYRRPVMEFPVATSNIPRPIPLQQWYMGIGWMVALGGILPFGAIFVELYFILTSMWMDRYYYVFGFLLLTFVILIGTCIEVTLVMVYFLLCAEDYHWWWRSFAIAGSPGFYILLYSTYYYYTRLDVHNVIGTMLYFGYMTIISVAVFLITGMTGHVASLWFMRKIYASIKVD